MLRAQEVKCLAIRDPWITRIGKGLKTYELRTRRTHFRGLLVLCSAQRRAKGRGSERFTDDGPKGVALYVAELVDCREATPQDARKANTTPVAGEFVWELSNVRALRMRVKVHNLLGLFNPSKFLMQCLRREGFLQ